MISSPALLAELAEVLNRPNSYAILARSNIDPYGYERSKIAVFK